MENRKDLKGIFLVLFIIISILLAGFIIYDKFLKKDNDSCVTVPCNCEEKKEKILANKYVIEEDKTNYIAFDTEKLTWEAVRNHCEGYEQINGTYYIENGNIYLNSKVFSDDHPSVVLKLIFDGNKVVKIHDSVDEEFHFAGCAPSDYYVIEK